MSDSHGVALRFSDDGMAEFERICARYPEDRRRSALIPTLRLAQEEFGYLSPAAIQYVAGLLELSPMDVFSVTSFYEMLHTEPVGEHHLWICHNLSCFLAGAENIIKHLEGKLGIRVGEVSRDRRFSLARAECLGACDRAPMMWCNDELIVDLTPERLDELIDQWSKGTANGSNGGMAEADADPNAAPAGEGGGGASPESSGEKELP